MLFTARSADIIPQKGGELQSSPSELSTSVMYLHHLMSFAPLWQHNLFTGGNYAETRKWPWRTVGRTVSEGMIRQIQLEPIPRNKRQKTPHLPNLHKDKIWEEGKSNLLRVYRCFNTSSFRPVWHLFPSLVYLIVMTVTLVVIKPIWII